ncbi:hypothetical protein ACVEU2_004620 [Enterobacter hormaechei]|uniref:hypothetical protein n=1 Tax=Enterobacter cloacae complex TaxID=354276 RepID=UPI000791225A|nr:hypothetical protein [Enterobacter hormaechei]MDV5252217.1 hypothetical protein [Enterobacter hormaechei]MDV5401103.1 hypothetical protein [Enterobacter hormaechei]MDV5617689.1 hypothetical protein [Enterobacter hormaechei]SAB72403.1 Uncharacterised protein [Enterobacter hormaechei]SAE12871.1 Uncharacterised protein [Enterobacter hormaechei]
MTNVSAVEKMAELMQQMEENSPRVAALQYCLTQVAEKVEEAEKRNAELEARCAALAAENALLKKSEPAPFSKLMMEALDVYQAGADEVPELAMLSAYKKLRDGLKTPATDDFLAEVRAQGVDAAIEHLINKFEGTGRIGVPVMALEWLAKDLRKGVQS